MHRSMYYTHLMIELHPIKRGGVLFSPNFMDEILTFSPLEIQNKDKFFARGVIAEKSLKRGRCYLVGGCY